MQGGDRKKPTFYSNIVVEITDRLFAKYGMSGRVKSHYPAWQQQGGRRRSGCRHADYYLIKIETALRQLDNKRVSKKIKYGTLSLDEELVKQLKVMVSNDGDLEYCWFPNSMKSTVMSVCDRLLASGLAPKTVQASPQADPKCCTFFSCLSKKKKRPHQKGKTNQVSPSREKRSLLDGAYSTKYSWGGSYPGPL